MTAPAPARVTESLGTLVVRGLLAGIVAGLLAGAVAFVVGEPHIDSAIAIEEAAAEPAEHSHEAAETAGHTHGDEDEPLVTRDGQRAGLFLATGLAGAALGAVFAVATYYARRSSSLSPPVLALVTAALGWLAIEAVPFAKYPANPPAVGDPDTIDQRTLLWLAAVVLGLAAVGIAGVVLRALRARATPMTRIVVTVATFVVVVVAGYLMLPTIDEVSDDFPATLLWQFRVSSLAVQATLWLVLGLAFAWLTERASRSESRTTAA
ncbi:CbtA family protein [Rhodococcus sp. HNM0569]|uniref:CbtA family protein n=1 Tax=Rhodococcus sp. HNM0569 TaxID=2716340 RepID=UPI00146DDB67|nr:CbtA family protein [Rhodococcus sp. HNM0569]NLU82113.1 CbtA family protein [Rhodococcus sp. HNM0569]